MCKKTTKPHSHKNVTKKTKGNEQNRVNKQYEGPDVHATDAGEVPEDTPDKNPEEVSEDECKVKQVARKKGRGAHNEEPEDVPRDAMEDMCEMDNLEEENKTKQVSPGSLFFFRKYFFIFKDLVAA